MIDGTCLMEVEEFQASVLYVSMARLQFGPGGNTANFIIYFFDFTKLGLWVSEQPIFISLQYEIFNK